MTDASNVTKAERTTFSLAGSEIEVFMLPDGSFRYSCTSLAASIGKSNRDLHNYMYNHTLDGKRKIKGSTLDEYSPENGCNLDGCQEKTPVTISVGRTRIKAIDQVTAVSYWVWKATNGNKEAAALLGALALEALDSRSRHAFQMAPKPIEVKEVEAVAIRHHLVQQLLDVKDWYKAACAEVDAKVALMDELGELDAEVYEDIVVPAYDELRRRKAAIEAVRLTDDEYASYVNLRSRA